MSACRMNAELGGRVITPVSDHAFVWRFYDAALQHRVAMRFARFTCVQTQDNVTSGWNDPTRDMIGDYGLEGETSLGCGPHWRTKCRKQSSLLLSSPLSASLLALRKSRLRLRLRSRPSPTTPASTSNIARGRRPAAAPCNPGAGFGAGRRGDSFAPANSLGGPAFEAGSAILPQMPLAQAPRAMLLPLVKTEAKTC